MNINRLSLTPAILRAVTELGPLTQTALTEYLYGTSGRNNPKLVELIRVLAKHGYLQFQKEGRYNVISISNKGLEILNKEEEV